MYVTCNINKKYKINIVDLFEIIVWKLFGCVFRKKW